MMRRQQQQTRSRNPGSVRRYGKVEALHHVTSISRRGEIVTVIGPNGAGKTTLLNGHHGPAAGRGDIDFQGQSQLGAMKSSIWSPWA
jgi:ABC-type branched-subunit amino acid transport system ATPase component